MENPSSWDDSIKFNKVCRKRMKQICNESDTNTSSGEDDSELQLNDFDNENTESDLDVIEDVQSTRTNELIAPPLLIKDNNELNAEKSFPNVYHILQCLTSKSANDNFDFERYEIIGDCFLKLTVVMKIYLQFTNTNEGNMAELKSQRVSNRYLFKLAAAQRLHEFVNTINFQPKVNWMLPNLNSVMKVEKDERFRFKLADKSLADCVEALLGCYLIHCGPVGASQFMQWLGFKISNTQTADDLNREYELPNPLFTPIPASIDMNVYVTFANTLNYTFNNIVYLYQAFTHPSYSKNRYTASYQKLTLYSDISKEQLI